MRTKKVGCYRATVTWGGHSEDIVYTLPDSGYEIVLYSCLGCGARFAAEPEAVHHFGVSLEERTSGATKLALGPMGPSHDVCPLDCCPAPRRRP